MTSSQAKPTKPHPLVVQRTLQLLCALKARNHSAYPSWSHIYSFGNRVSTPTTTEVAVTPLETLQLVAACCPLSMADFADTLATTSLLEQDTGRAYQEFHQLDPFCSMGTGSRIRPINVFVSKELIANVSKALH
jgi:hypothetical protein